MTKLEKSFFDFALFQFRKTGTNIVFRCGRDTRKGMDTSLYLENQNLVSFQKMQIFYLFKKWLTKKVFFCQPFFEKILFVCVVALPSKRFFFVNHFLFVSWPSLQIPFLLGKPFLIVPNLLWDTISFSHSKSETILYSKRLYGYW